MPPGRQAVHDGEVQMHMHRGTHAQRGLQTALIHNTSVIHKTKPRRGAVYTTQHHSHLEETGNPADVHLDQQCLLHKYNTAKEHRLWSFISMHGLMSMSLSIK